MPDTIANKIQGIQQNVQRVREIYYVNPKIFSESFETQDAVIPKILRATELSVQIAKILGKKYKTGSDSENNEGFDFLARKKIISDDLARSLKKMTGFSIVIMEELHTLDNHLVEKVINTNLNALIEFCDTIIPFT